MKLKDYIEEAKELDFKKGKNKQILPTLKEYHDDIFDITNGIRKLVDKDDEAAAILMLLMNARKQLKSYIDKRE